MKICVRGYSPLIVPDHAVVKERGAFDGGTPYVAKVVSRFSQKSYRENKLPSKLLCLERLRDRMESMRGYKSYSEPLAGIGLAVKIFEPRGKLYLNDFDVSCRAVLRHNFPNAEIRGEDVTKMELPVADLTFLDFNDFTLKRALTTAYGAVLDHALQVSRNFVVLNNCSCFYFRYGEKSFKVYSELVGRPVNSFASYFRAEANYFRKRYPDWYVSEVAYFRDTAFLLFSRQRSSFSITEIKPQPIVTFSHTLFPQEAS